ncbi:class I adenylate cyclase [Marinobacter nanhaiticus D15-8W]|uniref:Adenylate cyclase n=1 Tax=Marinobacter nanhaiticus D15-8W TaxID=626887 RepID=N6WUL2_9GAMM|nr:class I adenylate cyclase [Marinobacter nanhaiticus]ENO14692.1 adenylate cyclase [Marinobacter nanhaiticus D15-8W]BES69620.1 class I adenylate cyclase [Marinobacter nanhaiticus D15-8W]
MTAVTAINLDFADGIDRKTLKRLTDRFLKVNAVRVERARAALATRQQVVLDLLPLIFHLNHPSLPGYLHHDCPYGIAHYQPDGETLAAAQRQARSFRMRSAGRRPPDIQSLFVMGSPGTLGHSVASDLDVWLCHQPDLESRGIERLERKAEAVSRWAETLGLELHVFVFSASEFREGRQRVEVNGENCGSAQHYLLLDEFYRTGIYLAGCYPLWWLVPSDQEADYDLLADQLRDFRFIRADQYIDLGSVPAIPPAEFLGAGVWQLYKGIDAPWKSLLKLLLIECYARTREEGPLSLEFKARVYRGMTAPDRLDPYVMLYQRLEKWLQSLDATERLDLVRQSLYLKTGIPLTRLERVSRSWQSALLTELVEGWGWDRRRIGVLDDRQRWRAGDVQALRRIIVSELTHSYRFLSRLARTHAVKAAIRPEDMSLLGRKLYAAFQRKAGKVELINPNIAPTLAEENLSFHHQSSHPSGNVPGQGWLLYRDLETPSDAFWQPVIRRSSSLVEMLVWCHCNGLLTRATRLNLRAGDSALSLGGLRGMIEDLQSHLPVPEAPATREILLEESRPLRVLLFVNVAVDPQAPLTEKGLHKLSGRHDSLGFSGGRENLVLTLDQVILNSWHEVSVHRYEVGDTLIQCLKNLLAARVAAPDRPPVLTVHCHDAGHAGSIERRLQILFQDVQRVFFVGDRGPHPLRYIIQMERRYFVLQFHDGQPGFVALESWSALLDHLQKPQPGYVPIVLDRHALGEDPALNAVCQASQPDNIQVFFHIRDDRARVWVVDEHGSLSHWEQPFFSRRHLLAPVLRFLANVSERRQLRRTLAEAGGELEITCAEVVRRGADWVAERRLVTNDELPIDGFELQAVGVQEGDQPVRFDIFCEEQEFTALEYGDQLIPAVVHYVNSRRREGGGYPLYLTDLHLPHDLDPQVYQHDLQTSQYLHYRIRLEAELNQALGVSAPFG